MEVRGLASIVTGRASGLGAATAERLLSAGAKVTLLDRDAERVAAKAKKIGCYHVPTDIADEGAVARALKQSADLNGEARILINCAGIGVPMKVSGNSRSMPLADFSKVITRVLGTTSAISKRARPTRRVRVSGRTHNYQSDVERRGYSLGWRIVNGAEMTAFLRWRI